MTDARPNAFAEIFRAGPKGHEKLPALFYFSLSGQDSLNLPPFNQPVQFLENQNVRIFSFNLPFHTNEISNTDAMKEWVKKVQLGEDPLRDFLKESKKHVDTLFEQGLIDPERCAVGGLSRGAYAAIRLAASDRRFTHILGYAPLIDHSMLDQEGQESSPYSAFDCIEKIVGRPLSFFVGNHDVRVDTDTVYAFIRQLTLSSISNSIRSPEVELNIRPSIGFRGHGTSPETFQEGISWLLKKFGVL